MIFHMNTSTDLSNQLFIFFKFFISIIFRHFVPIIDYYYQCEHIKKISFEFNNLPVDVSRKLSLASYYFSCINKCLKCDAGFSAHLCF